MTCKDCRHWIPDEGNTLGDCEKRDETRPVLMMEYHKGQWRNWYQGRTPYPQAPACELFSKQSISESEYGGNY